MGQESSKTFATHPQDPEAWPLDFADEAVRRWREKFNFAFTMHPRRLEEMFASCTFASKAKVAVVIPIVARPFEGSGGEGQ